MRRKITIIGGVGNIGSTLAFQILLCGIADVAILDVNDSLVKGKSLDMLQALSVVNPKNTISYSNDINELNTSDIIIVTAGVPRKPGMTRDDLIKITPPGN